MKDGTPGAHDSKTGRAVIYGTQRPNAHTTGRTVNRTAIHVAQLLGKFGVAEWAICGQCSLTRASLMLQQSVALHTHVVMGSLKMRGTVVAAVLLAFAAFAAGAAPSTDGVTRDIDSQTALKPSCEDIWKELANLGQIPAVFKYPSDNSELKNVYCIPTKCITFTQATVSAKTSSGKYLDDVIEKFVEAGYYKKGNLPDVIRWSDDLFQSIDNRRIYCAKKADLAFVPAKVHSPDEPLPTNQLKRFSIHFTNRFHHNATRFASTWGEGAVFRSVLQPDPAFPMFGSFELPRVTPGREVLPGDVDFEDEI